MKSDQMVEALKALGEPTRHRIVCLLAHGELSVGELCRALGQSQPRVSRHLKTLLESGLLVRTAEGTSAFYALTGEEEARSLLDRVLSLTTDAPHLAADRSRLDAIAEERATKAERFFDQLATSWDAVRNLHVDDQAVEAVLVELVEQRRQNGLSMAGLVDLGTGTGRMLELLGGHFEAGLGIDVSPNMLNLARSRLSAAAFGHCAVRHGNLYALNLEPGSVDTIVVHHVLHYLDGPGDALAEAARVLAPDGQLLLVDFAPHHLDLLVEDHGHLRRGIDEAELRAWLDNCGLAITATHPLTPPNPTPAAALTTVVWEARPIKGSR